MNDHLAYGSYRKMIKDPGKAICRTVTKAIKESNIEESIKRKLYPKDSLVPKIYGLPNIHKQGDPLRPIVNTIGSPTYNLARSSTYNLAKYLAKLLKPLVGKTNSFVKYSAT